MTLPIYVDAHDDSPLAPTFWEQYMRQNLAASLSRLRENTKFGSQPFPTLTKAQVDIAANDPDTYWLNQMDMPRRLAFVELWFPEFSEIPASFPFGTDAAYSRAYQVFQQYGHAGRGMIVQAITTGAAASVIHRPVVRGPSLPTTATHPVVRAAGQAVAPTTTPGMSGTKIGVLSFLGGLAIGGGAVWFIKRPREDQHGPAARAR